jgi:hypothetical protein
VDHNPDDNNFEPRSWWQLHLPALLRSFTRLKEEEEADSGFHKTRLQEAEEEEAAAAAAEEELHRDPAGEAATSKPPTTSRLLPEFLITISNAIAAALLLPTPLSTAPNPTVLQLKHNPIGLFFPLFWGLRATAFTINFCFQNCPNS